MPDPIRIGSQTLARSWPDDSAQWVLILVRRITHNNNNNNNDDDDDDDDDYYYCTPARFRTGSVWPKPHIISQNAIGSGLVLHGTVRAVSGRTDFTESETGSGPVAFCQKPGPMIPAHRFASGQDTFAQNLTGPSRSGPDRFSTIWSGPSLEKRNQIGYGMLDPAYIRSGPVPAARWP